MGGHLPDRRFLGHAPEMAPEQGILGTSGQCCLHKRLQLDPGQGPVVNHPT
jgi:hypothetical protein